MVYPQGHDDKSVNLWGLKKDIVNTLFQAVKAITGGVTVIKGQIIKGGGYVISGAGKLLAGGGDAITHVGRHIASSAQLVEHPHKGGHSKF